MAKKQEEKKLTPLEPKFETWNIIAFDTEDNSKGTPLLFDAAFYDPDDTSPLPYTHKSLYNGKVRKHFTTKDRTEFINFIYAAPAGSLFVAHNLEYDLSNVFRDDNYKQIDTISYTARIVRATIIDRDYVFMDSFNWFAGSLAKIAKTVGMEKTALDPDSIDYVQNDTNILLEFATRFQDKLNKELQVGLSATIGGMAMKAFRTLYLRKSISGWNTQICLDAFYGGRCEVFYKGKVKSKRIRCAGNVKRKIKRTERVQVADFNSMYMFTMLNEYPDPETIEKGSYKNLEYGVGRFDVECPEDLHIPILPIKHEGKLVFPTGKFSGAWTFHEIRYAESYGYKVKQREGWGTNQGECYFRQYDEEFYSQRIQARQNGDNFGDSFYKGLGVNLFGKFIQHKDRVEARTSPMSKKEKWKLRAEMTHKLGPFYMYRIPMLEPPNTACYLWGAYVTSYARIHLHKSLQAVHDAGDTLLYCDTDSVMYHGNKSRLDLDEIRLGAMKVEKFKAAKFYTAKGYCLIPLEGKPKIACKGVSAPKADVCTNYLDIAQNPQLKFLETGESETVKPYRLKQALVQNKKANVWETFRKTCKTPYMKRTGEGITKPLVLNQ